MFFCDKCRIKNDWPGIIPMSYGPCEMCKEMAPCFDVPSKYLGSPPVDSGDDA